MKKIMLVCSAGMSTSLLVTKMEKAAKAKGLECEIFALSESEAASRADEVDIILLGPQVRYLLNKVKDMVKEKSIPVEVIDTRQYGLMDGESVINRAIQLLDGAK